MEISNDARIDVGPTLTVTIDASSETFFFSFFFFLLKLQPPLPRVLCYKLHNGFHVDCVVQVT